MNQDEAEVVKKPALALRPDDLHFDDRELAALQSMARFWLGMQSVGKAAGVARTVITYFGWAIGLYLPIRSGAIDWIRGIK